MSRVVWLSVVAPFDLHGVLRNLSFEGWHVGDVGLVQPLDPEVAVEVGGGLAQPVNSVVLASMSQNFYSL